tara:strand:+ start:896 stop:1432 length:537 start_codon:yes stop_codon:yes gene_type:complete
MFSAPIPGQSLTSEPKNSPWENPPQLTTPEDALMFHMDRLRKPKKVEAVAGLLVLGLDVVTLTEGILRGGVAEGRHSIDVSMIIGPIIHEYIVGVAEAAGLEYNEGLEEEDGVDIKGIEYSIRSKEAEKILKEIKKGKDVDLSEISNDMPEENLMQEEPEEIVEEQEEPMGLMSRRTI